jgi:hypothetical protein
MMGGRASRVWKGDFGSASQIGMDTRVSLSIAQALANGAEFHAKVKHVVL